MTEGKRPALLIGSINLADRQTLHLGEPGLRRLNYVDEASASYEAFRREREALAALERAFTAEIEKLFAAIPAADLALQWPIEEPRDLGVCVDLANSAAECDLGREPRPEIAGLLDLHHGAASL